MGIQHLLSFLKNQFKKETIYKLRNTSIAIDGDNLLHQIYRHTRNELFDFFGELERISELFSINFIFIFDGIARLQKIDELIRRRETKIKSYGNAFENKIEMQNGLVIPYAFLRVISELILSHHFEIRRAVHEGDELICEMILKNEVTAVVSSDSDFLVSNVKYVIPVNEFDRFVFRSLSQFTKDKLSHCLTVCDTMEVKRNVLKIFNEDEICLFSVIAGNDYSKAFVNQLWSELKFDFDRNDLEMNISLRNKFESILSFVKSIKYTNYLRYMQSKLSSNLYYEF